MTQLRLTPMDHFANGFALVFILAPYNAVAGICRGVRWLATVAAPIAGHWLRDVAAPALLTGLLLALAGFVALASWLGEQGRDTPAMLRNLWAWTCSTAWTTAQAVATLALLIAAVVVLFWKNA